MGVENLDSFSGGVSREPFTSFFLRFAESFVA
jgi:hypothetical protein